MGILEKLKIKWRLWRNAQFNRNYLRICNTERDPMESSEEFTVPTPKNDKQKHTKQEQ
jgi:hypothetical protein